MPFGPCLVNPRCAYKLAEILSAALQTSEQAMIILTNQAPEQKCVRGYFATSRECFLISMASLATFLAAVPTASGNTSLPRQVQGKVVIDA